MLRQCEVMPELNEQVCWDALIRRDTAQNGVFYAGVMTTGVYCLPSCPARKPLRKNVRFYETPADAERDGLRACLRCRPLEWNGPDRAAVRIEEICRYIEDHAFDPLPLAVIAGRAGLSPFHLQRIFKASTGVTPRAYVEACRLRLLKSGLRNGTPVTAAVYDAGYGSSSRVYEKSNAALGMTPRRYGRGAMGVVIHLGVFETSLGMVGIGFTGRGVCFIQFGDCPEQLRTQLEAEYPQAEIRDAGPDAEWVAELKQHIEGRAPDLNLPLDIRATAFQQLVWNYLRRIPYGQTQSYGEVAAAIGRPHAARAVANACAANTVALAIPCHRVVRENGASGGYRWGEDRKAAILRRERETAG